MPLVVVTKNIMRMCAFKKFGDDLRRCEKLQRPLEKRTLDVTGRRLERGTVALTRAKIRVIKSTKWAVNITKKYRVASFAMTCQRLRKLSPGVLESCARKMISENTRRSGVYTAESVLWVSDLGLPMRTID